MYVNENGYLFSVCFPPALAQDITGLFSHESCPHCVTCEFAENDCWYVTFDSEEDTQKVSPRDPLLNQNRGS